MPRLHAVGSSAHHAPAPFLEEGLFALVLASLSDKVSFNKLKVLILDRLQAQVACLQETSLVSSSLFLLLLFLDHDLLQLFL